jgi:hypothetical protein
MPAPGDFVDALPLAQSTCVPAPEGAQDAGIIRMGTMPNGEACYCLEPAAIQWLMGFCAEFCGPECSVPGLGKGEGCC